MDHLGNILMSLTLATGTIADCSDSEITRAFGYTTEIRVLRGSFSLGTVESIKDLERSVSGKSE